MLIGDNLSISKTESENYRFLFELLGKHGHHFCHILLDMDTKLRFQREIYKSTHKKKRVLKKQMVYLKVIKE
jgi:hypothetical protein